MYLQRIKPRTSTLPPHSKCPPVIHGKDSKSTKILDIKHVQQLRGQNLTIFDPLPPGVDKCGNVHTHPHMDKGAPPPPYCVLK